MPLKAPHLRPAFDWSGFYIGAHTGYGRGTSSAVLSDPLSVSTNSVVSGVIGGVQGGYNVRLPSGLLLGVEADLTFPNYLTSNSIVSTLAGARSEVTEQLDYVGTARGRIGYASGHWLAYATGGFAFAGERFINTPAGRRRSRKSTSTSGSAGPPAPAWNMPSRRTGACGSNISTASSTAPTFASRRARNTASTLDFQSAAHRPQPQGRLAGIDELDAEDRSDRSRIRSLGNPRPDHLSAAGLSGIPRALYRHQQPDAGAAGAGDLEQQPLSERPALGRRRGLLQSRTAAGLRLERHRRRSPDFPTARRRNRTSPTRITTPRGCSCARPSASAASRKSWPADSSSSRARSTSHG